MENIDETEHVVNFITLNAGRRYIIHNRDTCKVMSELKYNKIRFRCDLIRGKYKAGRIGDILFVAQDDDILVINEITDTYCCYKGEWRYNTTHLVILYKQKECLNQKYELAIYSGKSGKRTLLNIGSVNTGLGITAVTENSIILGKFWNDENDSGQYIITYK